VHEEIKNRLNSGNAYIHLVQNVLLSHLLLKNIKVLPVKRQEVTGDWRKLHNEELYDLYLLNVMHVIKSKRLESLGPIMHAGLVTGYGTMVEKVWTTFPTVTVSLPGTSISLGPLRGIWLACDLHQMPP
jgi:hypothetical protein